MTAPGSTNGATVGIAPTRSCPPSVESRTARSASPTAARIACARPSSSCPASVSTTLPPEPVEQPAADAVRLPFEPHDLLAERRLRHPLALGGAGETPGLGDRDEVPELVKSP